VVWSRPVARQQATEAEREPVLPAQPVATPSPEPLFSPPAPGEASGALRRVFGEAVSRPDGAFAGDFNGDGSQDLAVVVRGTRLPELNNELANWIVQDARDATARAQVSGGDVLLAVIHGYGALGWRDAEARQAYLLRNAVGADMRVKHVEGAAPSRDAPPRRFDVLLGRWPEGDGVVRWTGARYRRISHRPATS
jgi:hypothetical protein